MRQTFVLFFVACAFLAFLNSRAEGAIYWHFTLQAEQNGVEEWLWVTLREVPKKVYFREVQQEVKSLGGKGLGGARLVQVRARAWRKAYRSEEGIQCDTYLPEFGKRIQYWQESWSRWVFCEGQVLPPRDGEKAPGVPGRFQLGLLRSSKVQEIVHRQGGFLSVEGLPGEELKGKFNLYPLEYLDPLVHYEDTCRLERWAKHYRSLFMHDEILHDGFRGVGLGFATVRVFGDLVLTYSLYRSRSPQHRFFGRRIADFSRVQDIFITEELAAEETLLGGEETMVFSEEDVEAEGGGETMVFTEEEVAAESEEVMTFTPEEIDLSQEEGIEVTWREEETPADMVFTEEETR